ncbi:MAG TPA: heavy metal-associated domain-containing protein [Candidatus Limnocylindrales bacterium]|nr:heavy metal-associated domain-containing protein [Candidatus Limnocylindrales bacterium]
MKIKLLIKGMGCASCARNIENILQESDGIKQVLVDLAAGKADVEFDPEKISTEQILSKIEDAGYQGELAATGN